MSWQLKFLFKQNNRVCCFQSAYARNLAIVEKCIISVYAIARMYRPRTESVYKQVNKRTNFQLTGLRWIILGTFKIVQQPWCLVNNNY